MSGCPFMHQPEKPAPVDKDQAEVSGEKSVETAGILGFNTTEKSFISGQTGGSEGERPPGCHYSSYLGVDQLLSLQHGQAASKPNGEGMMHHEENTFVIVHQVFELWFRLVLTDLTKARDMLRDVSGIDDHDVFSQLVSQVLHYLGRAEAIINHATGGFAVMETMHPSDFLEFRDYLVPASGFQSQQFRRLEQLLGVVDITRAKVNGAGVLTYLLQEEQAALRATLSEPSLNDCMTRTLAKLRVPVEFPETFLNTTRKVLEIHQFDIARAPRSDKKAQRIIDSGVDTARQMLENPAEWCEGVVVDGEADAATFKSAVVAALFAISYRNEPRFAVLAMLLDRMVAVEEGMLLWRSRHLHMAERMIGRRGGTGGTGSGVGYLDETRRYRVFHGLWLTRKLAVRSSALPPLASYGKEFTEGSVFM